VTNTNTHTHTLTHTLLDSVCLLNTHSHASTLFLTSHTTCLISSLSHTHSFTHPAWDSYSYSLSHTHTLTHTLTEILSLSLCHTHTLTRTLPEILSLSLSLTHTHTHTHLHRPSCVRVGKKNPPTCDGRFPRFNAPVLPPKIEISINLKISLSKWNSLLLKTISKHFLYFSINLLSYSFFLTLEFSLNTVLRKRYS